MEHDVAKRSFAQQSKSRAMNPQRHGQSNSTLDARPSNMGDVSWRVLTTILGVMAFEGLFIFLIVTYYRSDKSPKHEPAAKPSPVIANKTPEEVGGGDPIINNQDRPAGRPDLREVTVGDFAVSGGATADSTRNLRVDCRVVLQVAERDVLAFDNVLNDKQHRIREAIVLAIRRSSVTEIREPSLDSVKRRIRAEVDTVLGKQKRFIEGIVIPDFVTQKL